MLAPPLEEAAQTGDWYGINTNSITKEMLKERGELDETIFHIAADSGTLSKIPKELWSKEAWLETNQNGDTVLHLATSGQEFHLIPKDLLNKKILRTKNLAKETIISYICAYQPLKNLPKKLLSDGILGNMADKQGSCLISTILILIIAEKMGKKEKANLQRANIRVILGALSQDCLKKHLKKGGDHLEGEKAQKLTNYVKTELYKRELIKISKNEDYLEI